jgi:hypothetical protein
MAVAGPDAGGQDCDGALVDGKAPIGTRLLRPGGSEHHSRTRPTDQAQDTEGQPENGSDRAPEQHTIILTAGEIGAVGLHPVGVDQRAVQDQVRQPVGPGLASAAPSLGERADSSATISST